MVAVLIPYKLHRCETNSLQSEKEQEQPRNEACMEEKARLMQLALLS